MHSTFNTHRIHRIIITMDDEFFAKLLENWDLGLRVQTRRGAKKLNPKPSAKEIRNNISQRMWHIYPGSYGTNQTGWGPLSSQMRVEWPQHLSGGITPFDVEIIVEVDKSVTKEELTEQMVADEWEKIAKIHLGDPIPFAMYVDVRIVRVSGLHRKFLIGEPESDKT